VTCPSFNAPCQELPQVENIDDLQEDIFATESDLLEITNE
jgi:hypothetical protein